jgi:uncharacterized protein YndB with AHSA1/START domain
MWKWIGGILGGIVLLCVVAVWWGFKKFTAGGDTVMVTIGAPPQRVFASLANHDSIPTWRLSGNQSTQHGPIAPGDTLASGISTRNGTTSRMHWAATAVERDHLVALALTDDSTGNVVATRRDSIVAVGDSTKVVSTIASPMLDSPRTADPSQPPSRRSAAAMDVASRLVVSSFRMQSKFELTRLKNRLEGHPDAPVSVQP